MFDRTFPSDETHDDLSDPGSPNGMGTFYRTETPRPDTVALLAELGMPVSRDPEPLSPPRPASGLTAE